MIRQLLKLPQVWRSRKIYVCLIALVSLPYLCCLVASAAEITAATQADDVPELLVNAPVERELSGGETQVYKITLAAGTYLRLLITPHDTNVESYLFAPGSSTDLGVCYFPSEKGLHFVSLVAESSGSYRLKIRLAENDAKMGRYEVKIEEKRPATEQDRIRIAAEKVEHEGKNLLYTTNPAQQKRQGIAKYEEALGLWRQIGERKGELRMLAYIAIKYREQGEPQTALQYAKQAIQSARAIGDRYQEANLTITFAILYKSLGENQKALDSFNQARQLFKNLSATYGEAIAVSHIGVTLAALGEWQDALHYFKEALPVFSSLGDRYGECGILNAMGAIHRMLGDQETSIEMHKRALEIAQANNFIPVEASALTHLGSTYLKFGDKQKALDFSEQAVKLWRTLGDPFGEGDALKMIGEVACLLGEYQKALDSLNQSLRLFRSLWERDREAKALHTLAQVNTSMGNLDEARKQIEAALEIQEALRVKVISQQLRETIFTSAQSSFALYIDLLMQLHKRNPAAGYEAAALQASERARARSLLDLLAESRADIRQGVPKNLLELERSLQQQINAKAAARTSLLSDKRKQAQAAYFDKEIAELTSRYHEIEVQIRQSSPRYTALTQPQPLSSAEIQQHLDDRTVLLEFALGEKQSWLWTVTRSSINSHQLPSSHEIEPAARKVYELLTARQPKKGETENQYEARIAEADLKFLTASAALSQTLFGQVAAKLQGEWKDKRLAIVTSGALEYIPFATLPSPLAGSRSSVVSEEPVSGHITAFRNKESEVNKGKSNLSDQDRQPPTDDRLPTTGYRPLIADHEIVNLPSVSVLAVIRNETAGRKLAEKSVAVIADPVFEPTDVRLLSATRKSANHHLVATVRAGVEPQTPPSERELSSTTLNAELTRSINSFHLIKERGGFSRLPFSREEAEVITSLAPKNSSLKATDFQANRAIVISGQLRPYRILHFATHGLLNSERPELSGLVLSLLDEEGKAQDGFLRMNEIYNLNLPADLVVLSACQTALGKQIKGEGLVGLTRGFMYAGAPRVVASLWQVDDLATAELMKSFYRRMLKQGLRPAAALRAAQLEMLGQKRWSSPFFWAAFTLQGEWR